MALKDWEGLSESLTSLLSFKHKCDIARKEKKNWRKRAGSHGRYFMTT